MLNRPTHVMLSTSAAALVAILMACGPGCAGAKTRDNVLLPAISRMWPAVRESASSGGGSTELLTGVDAAIRASDGAVLARDADRVAAHALENIRRRELDGAIGPNVAKLLREEVAQFVSAAKTMGGAR